MVTASILRSTQPSVTPVPEISHASGFHEDQRYHPLQIHIQVLRDTHTHMHGRWGVEPERGGEERENEIYT